MNREERHRRLDALARRAEATITKGRDVLNSIDVREGASERAHALDRFMRENR